MGVVRASAARIAKERVYAAATVLSWALALVLAAMVPTAGEAEDCLATVSRSLPDYIGVFLLVSIPACAYVFGRGLHARTISLEIASGNSRASVFAVHAAEFLTMTLLICLSSSLLACFSLAGVEVSGFDNVGLRMVALVCALAAMVSPVCLAIVLLRDVLRVVTASVLMVFIELWGMALIAHPYVSPYGDLAQDLPPLLMAHPAVALKMAVLPEATTGQLLLVVFFCVVFSVVVLLIAWAIWRRAELR